MERLIRMSEVVELTGLAKSTIYLMVSKGSFPSPLKIGERSVAWRETDLDVWLESKKKAAIKQF